jgi:hypothetical protein
MEYLATYGWALLLIVIVLSVLIQLGLFNSAKYIRPGDEVTGFNSFDVSSTRLLSSGEIQMSMSNKLEEPVTITEILVDGLPLASISPALPFSLPAGGRVTVTGESAAGGDAGDIYDAQVSVKFDVENGNADHADSGMLRGELQPGSTGHKACSDGIDNDGDGLTDYPADPGCENGNDGNEADNENKKQCNDGIDNDNDGLTDYPLDPGCSGPGDDDETGGVLKECQDNVDNDNDGYIDYPADTGCSSALDDDETNAPADSCGDTDGGLIYNVTGTASGYYGGLPYSYTDSCASGTNLNEYYCSGTLGSSTAYACTDMGADYACSEGKCVYSPPPPPGNYSCSDSDGGIVYNVTGTTSGYYNGSSYEYTDSCFNSSSLTEYFCASAFSNFTGYACGNMGANYTCSEGKCMQNQSPPQNQTNCTDSDSYLPMEPNYPIASQIGTVGTCTDASGNHTDISVNSSYLNEFYCGPTQNPVSCLNTTWYNCISHNYTGSSGGQCIRENASNNNSCSDSDGGLIYNVTGTASGYYNNTPYSYTDSCYNATWVNEQFCSATRSNSSAYWCINMGANYTCSSGKCVYTAPPPPNDSCSDTDGGLIYNVTGTVNGTYNGTTYSYTDQCFGTTTLYEHYCTGTTNHSEMFTCSQLGANYTCSSGKCVLNQSSPQNCTDTDSYLGTPIDKNYPLASQIGVYATCTDASGSHTDISVNSTYLNEFYCGPTSNPITCLNTTWYNCISHNYTGSSGGKCYK